MTRIRAFATVTAVGLMLIAGVGLAALTSAFAHDIRRSLRHSEEAQLRQLLLAGQVTVEELLDSGALAEGEVKLPDALTSGGVSLTCETLAQDGSQERRVLLTARGEHGGSMRQTLAFIRSGKGWMLVTADLGDQQGTTASVRSSGSELR